MSAARKRAVALYDAKLPYHNFLHALRVASIALEIARRCIREGLAVDVLVVYLAALFHDAGYHLDHVARGFASKEELAVSLTRPALEAIELDEHRILAVEKTILATQRDAVFTTVEEKIVRAADLDSLASTYNEFLTANRQLKAEFELLQGEKLTWTEWKEMTRTAVTFYLGQDIRLTSAYADHNGHSIFHQGARENLERFLKAPEENLV